MYGAIFTAVAYIMLGIPATVISIFVYNYGIRGIWLGPLLATSFLTIVYTIIFKRVNWQDLIDKARL